MRLRHLMRVVAVVAAVEAGFPSEAAAQSCTQIDFEAGLLLAGVSAEFVFLADTNGDGKLDVVAVNNGVTTLHGNGDGTFQAGIATAGPASPSAAVVGFFDGDGWPDLAISAGSDLHVLLGDGTDFDPPAAPSPYSVGSTTQSLAAGDLDRDGKLDLVVGGVSNTQWLRGIGDGTFAAAAVLFGSLAAEVVKVADFDADGNPDLAMLVGNDVQVALGDGLGGFAAPASVAFTHDAVDMDVGDFDRDGRVDLAVVSRPPGKKISTRLGNGNGTFGAPNDTGLAGNNPVGLQVGNLNGDEKPDVAVTLQGAANVESLAGVGDGTFTSLANIPYTGSAPTGQAGGDLNGDGLDDIVVADGGAVYVVINSTGAECIRFLAVTSRGSPGGGTNLLQWMNPAGVYPKVRIAWNTGAGCAPPAAPGAGAGFVDEPYGPASAKRQYLHTSLALDTPVCYAVFVKKTEAPDSFSGGRPVQGRPFDATAGRIRWAYSTGAASVAPPSIGGSGLILASNDRLIHSVARGPAGGQWPSAWTPFPLGGAAQSRSAVAGVTVGTAGSIAIVGAQDGYVHLLNATTGARLWPSPPATPTLGAAIQGAPAALLAAFGGAHNYILAGTRNVAAENHLYALDPATGGVEGRFSNGGGANRIGPVNAGAAVDYASSRVYFTSRRLSPGSTNTLWCFALGAPPSVFTLLWSRTEAEVGQFDASPVLRNGRLYVANTAGTVYSMDAATGGDLRSFATGDGAVKGFVFPDRRNNKVYFSTDRKVWGLADTAGGFVKLWNEVDLPTVAPAHPGRLPSGVLHAAGTDLLYVGAGDGKLWQLDTALATLAPDVPPVLTHVVLGDGLSTSGMPSRDSGYSPALIYLGTTAGVVYAVEAPLP